MTDLELEFKSLNIDYSDIGFYDNPEFMEIENRNPDFLQKYAEYVLNKEYPDEYINNAKDEIPFIVQILNNELIKDGRLGACIDISMVLSRVLEKEGYWNYVTKGSLTNTYSDDLKLNPNYFWAIDDPRILTGHSWVVAPPFYVIDLSVKQQLYKNGEEKYIPKYICSSEKLIAEIEEIDVISHEMSAMLETKGILKNKLKYCIDNFEEFVKLFPPINVVESKVVLKYVTTAIGASDCKLENITGLKLNGRFGIQIYNDLILPKLIERRNKLQM